MYAFNNNSPLLEDMVTNSIKNTLNVGVSGTDIWLCYTDENNICRSVTFAVVCD